MVSFRRLPVPARSFPALAALLTISLFFSCQQAGPVQPGRAAPDFGLETLSHGRFYLNQQKGRVVVLVFWSTICLGCKEEMLELKALAKIRPAPPVVAAVCIDPEEMGRVRQIARDLGVDFPILLDRGKKVFSRYKLQEVPSTVVVDAEGRVAMVRVGYDPALMKGIRSKVQSLVSGGGS